jgi:hypothetical protein
VTRHHDLVQLRADLRSQPYQGGKEIYNAVPARARVKWARRVLQACIESLGEDAPEAVHQVLALTNDPAKWSLAHDAFTNVRRLSLQGDASPRLKALLDVAETVAKVTYNASGASAPFDADCAYWLASRTLAFSDALAQESAESRVWQALTERSRA